MAARNTLAFILCFIAFELFSGEFRYLEFRAKTGDATYHLFKKYELEPSQCNLYHFKEINRMSGDMSLFIDRIYKLPVVIFTFNKVNIRTTIGNQDYDLAKKIQAYNESMVKKGLKQKDYRNDNVLWVPFDYLYCNPSGNENMPPAMEFSLFGEKYKNIEVKNKKLEGNIYYIISGHGGPDPGAMGKYNGHTLCEDEYAYDISLRLAKNLIERGATVFLITQDNDDGIRDETILEPDKDEVYYKDQEIPLNQIERLNLGCKTVNDLFEKYKKDGTKRHLAINLHVDSRSSGQRIDMFFYHKPGDDKGKQIAGILKDKVAEKYNHHQKNRGYFGTVKSRDLHVLRKVNPTSVFIELGNIRNSADQKRFVVKDNRQAVANWLTEGLMEVK
jgi:N-acetylmuramoyl-L-alanine amidase